MREQVTITIAEGGATEVAVQGCAGPSCAKLTEAIEQALGTVTSDVRTPEYYQTAKQSQQTQQGQK